MTWHRLARVLARLREFTAIQLELHERLLLVNRPWEEELLHWSYDGRTWLLHGQLPPPPDGRPRSTTRTGWCPACRAPIPADSAPDDDCEGE